MKRLFIKILQKNAKKAILKFNPQIVVVTGSIGKTSTKEAIGIVLKDKKSVRIAKKNYNNEVGVPLAILGEESQVSLLGWIKLLIRSMKVKNMPSVIVLEFGVDRRGDIDKLAKIVKPDIAVITGISTVHAEFFTDLEELVAEKAKLLSYLSKDGVAILNADDEKVFKMGRNIKQKKVYFGMKAADVSADNISIKTRIDDSFEPGEDFVKTTADVKIDSNSIGTLELKNVIGYAPVMACLAGIAVSREFEINTVEAIESLNNNLSPVAGRLNPIAGIKGTLLIDDSYNAAPSAVRNGLDIVKMFTPGEEWDRRIVALGEMKELGKYSDSEHEMIGVKVSQVADVFVAVGEMMLKAVQSAKKSGMDEGSVYWFSTSQEAGKFLDKYVQQGDVIYIKGSQSSRMEKVVKDLMAEPLRASELLVRQEEKWLKN